MHDHHFLYLLALEHVRGLRREAESYAQAAEAAAPALLIVVLRWASRPLAYRPGWLVGCGALLGLALILFAVPAGLEGRALVPISPGHALSVLDALALAPLSAGMAILTAGLWRRRQQLRVAVRGAPWLGSAVIFSAGAGLGLLLASVFPFFWWWATGAALFTAALAAVTLAAVRGSRDTAAVGHQ